MAHSSHWGPLKTNFQGAIPISSFLLPLRPPSSEPRLLAALASIRENRPHGPTKPWVGSCPPSLNVVQTENKVSKAAAIAVSQTGVSRTCTRGDITASQDGQSGSSKLGIKRLGKQPLPRRPAANETLTAALLRQNDRSVQQRRIVSRRQQVLAKKRSTGSRRSFTDRLRMDGAWE